MGETTMMTPEAEVPFLAVGNQDDSTSSSNCCRFTFGQTLSKTFGMLWERLDVFAGLYAVTLPFLGLYIGLVFAVGAVPDEWIVVLAIVSLIFELVWFVMAVIASAAIVYTAACIVKGSSSSSSDNSIPSFRKAIKVAAKRACTIMAASMLLVIPESLLLMLALNMEWDKHHIPMCVACVVVWTICGALLLWMILGSVCLVPSIMIGHYGPLTAIKKSFGLACGNYLYLLCIMFSVGVMEQGLLALVQVLVGSFDDGVFMLIYLQSALVVGPLLVFPALSSILVTVIYIGLCRCKNDGGFSNEDLARQLAMYDNTAEPQQHQEAVGTTEASMQEPLLESIEEA